VRFTRAWRRPRVKCSFCEPGRVSLRFTHQSGARAEVPPRHISTIRPDQKKRVEKRRDLDRAVPPSSSTHERGHMVALAHRFGGEMRRHSWSGISAAMVFAATVGVVAQSSPQNSPQPTPEPTPQPPTTAQAPAPSPPQSSEGHRITVAGCLQEAPPGPVGTSGSAQSVPPAATDAPPATDAPAKPDAASGDAKLVLANAVPSPAETAASSSAPQTYQLIANAGALKPHLGKKLELSGTVEDQNSSANVPSLRVEAGKVIAETCTK
jgi:hypothetical protein